MNLKAWESLSPEEQQKLMQEKRQRGLCDCLDIIDKVVLEELLFFSIGNLKNDIKTKADWAKKYPKANYDFEQLETDLKALGIVQEKLKRTPDC